MTEFNELHVRVRVQDARAELLRTKEVVDSLLYHLDNVERLLDAKRYREASQIADVALEVVQRWGEKPDAAAD